MPYATEDTAHPSNFDFQGRSKAARYAETALCFLRADRQLARLQPELLQIALEAKTIAQDAFAVPSASRGFFSSHVTSDHLSDLIRETEGALSYSLALLDEVNIAWHTSTITMLQQRVPPESADCLQRLLLALTTRPGSDISSRVFRDALSRLFRQSGAGESEADTWLTYGMSNIDDGEFRPERS